MILTFVLLIKTGIIPIKLTIKKDLTWYQKTLLGYEIWINSHYFRIPFRNSEKVKLREEIQYMISCCDEQQRRQKLNAMFSWLKTWEKVRQFEKDYSVVDRKYVEKLVNGFVPRINVTSENLLDDGNQ